MFDCSNLVHHDSLIPPEKMLVSYSPSLQDQSLYSFLSRMDDIEYRLLRAEDNECRPHPNSLSGAERFGVGGISWIVGGLTGLYSGAVPALYSGVPIFNPYTAVAGGSSAGLATASWMKKSIVEGHQAKACSQVSLNRMIRLTEKGSDIKKRAEEVINSWNPWKD